jgi:hypothetical protein
VGAAAAVVAESAMMEMKVKARQMKMVALLKEDHLC